MEVLGQTKYKRINQIGVGQGKNSEVYLAEDLHLAGQVAVKELPRSNFPPGSGLRDYFAEAQVMFAAGHPNPSNVVPIRYACDCPGVDKISLVMPFYKNGSLQDRICQGPLNPCEVIRVGLGMLNGLNQVHLAGYLHFDLKPSNVLFSDNNDPQVADFGQTRPVGPVGTSGLPKMYPEALPPEFFLTGLGTVQTDIYQAGLTLYRAVNGHPFFKSQKPSSDMELATRTTDGTFPDREAFLPHVPKALRRVIRTTLMVEPGQRFRSATDFQDALAKIGIDLDWKTTVHQNGQISWRAERLGKPDLVVELLQIGKKWRVEQHTENNGQRRARNPRDWPSGLTHHQAFGFLKQLFRSL